jgi:L-threonylcarbamoyladenylate synthase
VIVEDNPVARAQAAAIISRGGIVAFRTDTFYGLGADPFNQQAVLAIRKLKGREEAKPILVLIGDAQDLDRFIAQRSALFDRVCERHWPGPLTLIGRARDELPEELTAGTGTIGLRLPDDEGARELVRACGGALTATSANLSGQPPARTAREVELYFPNGIDLIIDGGAVTATQASTVVDLRGPKPLIIREGAIAREKLQESFLLREE